MHVQIRKYFTLMLCDNFIEIICPKTFSIQINFYAILYEFSDLTFFKHWYFSSWTKDSLLPLRTAG